MGVSVVQSYLSDILHVVSQGLLIPTIAILLVLIGYALYCIGSIIAEYATERRNFKVSMPRFLSDLMCAKQDEIPGVIAESGLLNRQKVALLTVYDYRTLPGDALVALIRRLVNEEETRYDRISGRNNMAARVSPMIGLMGTLIPLGPGIEALGRADTSALSSSLLIAFDTTVAGLVVAALCLIIGKIRTNWYGNYMSALDSGMATMLQKIEDMREAGEIKVKEPTDYAFLFAREHGSAKSAASSDANAQGADAPQPNPNGSPNMAAPAPVAAPPRRQAESMAQVAERARALEAKAAAGQANMAPAAAGMVASQMPMPAQGQMQGQMQPQPMGQMQPQGQPQPQGQLQGQPQTQPQSQQPQPQPEGQMQPQVQAVPAQAASSQAMPAAEMVPDPSLDVAFADFDFMGTVPATQPADAAQPMAQPVAQPALEFKQPLTLGDDLLPVESFSFEDFNDLTKE